jgi:hypothetical protein
MPKFLAVYVGTPSNGPPPDMSPETIRRGMQAWGDWMQQHAAAVVEQGGPLGKTKEVSSSGINDIRNRMGGYVVVQADSHEAAAAMFEGHPHFSIFPGDGVEVMPVLDIPKMPD